MSYQEKRTIVSIITILCILISYSIYTIGQFQSGVLEPENIKALARIILIFMTVAVLAGIVIQIIFHILLSITIAIQEKMQNTSYDHIDIEKVIDTEMIVDEMDKIIELKAMRIGFVVVCIGFILSLISLQLNYSVAVMMNIIFVSFMIASLLSSIVQLYFYKVGVKNV